MSAPTELASGRPDDPAPRRDAGGSEHADTIRRPVDPIPATMVPIATPSATPPSSSDPSRPPRRIGRYELQRELGRGGMGVVWLAFDQGLKRDVALKVLPAAAAADPELRLRFRREAEAVARLVHPNVVTVFEVGETALGEGEPVPFFAMEYVRGRTLAEEIRARGRLAPAAAMRWLRDVACGVAAAHAQGIVHRDIKPENVLLAGAGDDRPVAQVVPKLADFGLARVAAPEGSTRLTVTRVVMGTPAYMAPEQARGDTDRVGPASDVYALGAVLYEALTGAAPYLGSSSMDILMQKLRVDPPPPRALVPTLAPDVQTIVQRAMEREPERRYASAGDFADDVGRCLEGEAIHARPPSRFYRSRRWVLRNKALAAAALVIAFVIGRNLWLMADRARIEAERVGEVEAARQALLLQQAERRAAALPHFASGEDAREKARQLVWMEIVGERIELLQRAEVAYGRALFEDPGFVEAWVARGRVRADLGEVAGALNDLDRAIALSPQQTDALIARIALRTMEYETLWTRSVKVRSLDFERMTELPDLKGDPVADRLVSQIQSDVKALKDLRVKPEEASYYDGWLKRVQGDAQGARADFERCKETWKYYAPAYEGLASLSVLSRTPDLAEVEKYVKLALKCDPGSLRARIARLYLWVRAKDYLKAAVDLGNLVKMFPRYAPLYLLRGYVNSGVPQQTEQAEADFRKALELDPDCALASIALAVRLQAEKRQPDALAVYADALRRTPDHPLCLLMRGDLLLHMGRREEGLADLARAIEVAPDFVAPRVRRFHVRIEVGDLEGATSELKQAVEVAPTSYDVLIGAASGFARLKRPADALPYVEAGLSKEPARGDLHYVRGTALSFCGRNEEAATEFEEALKDPALTTSLAANARRQADRLRQK